VSVSKLTNDFQNIDPAHHQGHARSENTVTDMCFAAAFLDAVDIAAVELAVANRRNTAELRRIGEKNLACCSSGACNENLAGKQYTSYMSSDHPSRKTQEPTPM
jgi:coenzyme F420-reducing hydrogenase gamma subunit